MREVGHALGWHRFQIVRPLGSGSYGTVYEAIDLDSNDRVALKELTRVGPSALLRFKHEFRALSDVHHPNLVPIKELIEQHGRWYIVMELVEGEGLLDYVRCDRDARGFDEQRLRMAFGSMAEGIAALHSHGILHRDLKPSNVRVTARGRTMLLDFGLVTSVDIAAQSTEKGAVGSLAYMAPEQIKGDTLGPAADWYAFGTCLYEALASRRPYEGENALAVALAKTQRPPADPSTFVYGLPEDLRALSLALLQNEPELRPIGAQVLNALRNESAGGSTEVSRLSPNLVPQSPFTGRDAELQHLDRALSRAQKGALSIVLVEGESGVGKSELVAEFLRRQRARDPRTLALRSRCYQNEQVAYKAFDGCIDELAQVLKRMGTDPDAPMPVDAALLSQLFPVLSDVPAIAQAPLGNVATDPSARRLQAFAALSALLAQLAEKRPLILVMDDLQWADNESFRLLRAIVEASCTPPILVLTTARSRDELEPDALTQLETVRALPCVHVISITGLPPRQAEQLANQLLGAGADPELAGVIALESRGHPLFLSELVQFSRGRDLGARFSPTLEAALTARIERLPRQAYALLELMAIAARPHRAGLFAEALGVPKLDEAVSVLLGAKLVRTRRDQELDCFHDRVRQVMVGLIAKQRLSSMHRCLAEALERDFEADPTERATHWDLAQEPQRAVKAYEHAANEALRALAFVQAERLYERALALLGDVRDERRARLMVGRASALACTGRSAEAAELYGHAAELTVEPEQRLRLRSKVAQHLMLSGDVRTGLETCRQLLAEVGVTLPVSDLGALLRAVWDRLLLRLRGHGIPAARTGYEPRDMLVLDLLNELTKSTSILRTTACVALTAQHARRALAVAEPNHVSVACANEGWLHYARGRRTLGDRFFERARELCLRTKDAAANAWLARQEGSALIGSWEFRRGTALLEQAESLYQAHVASDPWSLTVTRYQLGIAWHGLGDHARLAEKMALWIGEALERRDRVAVALLSGMGYGATRLLMRGRPQEALDELDDALLAVPPEPFSFAHLGHMIGVQQVLTFTASGAARNWLELQHQRLSRSFVLRTRFGRQGVLLMRSNAALRAYEAASASERTNALAEVRKAARVLMRQASVFTTGFAEHLLAQAAALDGPPERALVHARAARQAFAQIDYVGVHAASYLEGVLEATPTGSRRCAAALAFFRDQGWVDPVRALTTILPILPALAGARPSA